MGRLTSLDVFRGITIAGMLLVGNPGSRKHVYAPLLHAEWHGWTPADLVFPFFLFIVGVAMLFSFRKRKEREESTTQLMLHVLRRSVILFLLGLILNGFPDYNLTEIRILGVLQRIAICYLFASVITLKFNVKGQAIWAGILLAVYWVLMELVPVPGIGAGVLEKGKDLGSYIDRLVLGGHLWGMSKTWDPEGLLSTIPAISTTLFGVLTGQWLISKRSPLGKTVGMFFMGTLALFVGLVMNIWFPINKALWTSSYSVFTVGMALYFLAMCYWTIDIKKWRFWTKPFVVLGTNAITVFFLSEIFALILYQIRIPQAGGASVSLKSWLYTNIFMPLVGYKLGSLLYAICFVLLWTGIMSIFYKRSVFIKI